MSFEGDLVISTCIKTANEKNKIRNLADFVDEELEFVAQSLMYGEDMAVVRPLRFKKVADALQITIRKSKPDWPKVALAVMELGVKEKSSATVLSPVEPLTVATSVFYSLSSSSCSTQLSSLDKAWVQSTYECLKDDMKWKLKTGKKVEDEMFKLAMRCSYQHPTHSLIIDPEDPHWADHFTTEELEEIKTFKALVLDNLPEDLHEYLLSYRGKRDLESLCKNRRSKSFHPTEEPELHWAHKAIIEATDLYFYDYMRKTTQTEDESCLEVRLASSERKNEGRVIDSAQRMRRKSCGKKVDMLFSTVDYEFGCVEAGLLSDTDNTKLLKKGSIKLPKLLKDMFLKLVKSSPSLVRDIQMGGFLINGLDLTALILDSPAGYACRVHKFAPLKYPSNESIFSKQMMAPQT